MAAVLFHTIGPLGYDFLMPFHDMEKLLFDLRFGSSCVLIKFIVASIVAAKISVISVEMPDKHIGKIPGSGIGILKTLGCCNGR